MRSRWFGGATATLLRAAIPLLFLGVPAPWAAMPAASADTRAPRTRQVPGEEPEFLYRADLTQQPIEVTAYFPLRERKDFAFLHTLSGVQIVDLKVRDEIGARAVDAAEDPATWRVAGLESGVIQATYRLPLGSDCAVLPCRDAAGVVLSGGDLILTPVGVDPMLDSVCRIELLLPPRWSVATLEGEVEPILSFPRLAEAKGMRLLASEQTLLRATDRTLLSLQVGGWRAGADVLGRLLGLVLREQQRLLGTRPEQDPALIRVVPTRQGCRALSHGDLFLLELEGNADRGRLATLVGEQFAALSRERLQTAFSGAADPAVRWWRQGFNRYVGLISSVRTGAAAEDSLIATLQQAWLEISSESPLRGQVSPAAAGAMATSRRSDAKVAEAFVSDSGLIACFLLDLKIRTGSRGASTLGGLLAATAGRTVTNALLQAEASRLARADVGNFFRRFIVGTRTPPFAEEASLAGLELVEIGTGLPFTGFTLATNEPVIISVFRDGPARAMGLLAGDRLVEINGQPIRSGAAAEEALSGRQPGEEVEIRVRGQDGLMFLARIPLWEEVKLVLRRSPRAPASARAVWSGLTHGETATFTN